LTTPRANGEDARLQEVFLNPIRSCADYRPAFGQAARSGLQVAEFQALYGRDPFYSWLGLDTAVVYSAHKAAGGLTSVYRQIGVGAERLFRAVVGDCFNLSADQLDWGYEYEGGRGKVSTHTLDAKVDRSDLNDAPRARFQPWLDSAAATVASNAPEHAPLTGAVFEVRQGYKSADSKRQNADLRFGINAYRSGLLPVFAIFSTQVSSPVLRRYRSDGMLVLTGVVGQDPTTSTFAFLDQVIGFDLVAFFQRNRDSIRREVNRVAELLLQP